MTGAAQRIERLSGFAFFGAGEGRVMKFMLHPGFILVNYLENVFDYGMLLGR